jgi:lathosterol oxidase
MDWLLLLECFAITVGGGLAVYWIPSLFLDWIYYKQRKDEPETWKVQPDRWAPKRLAKEERKLGTLNMIMLSVISGILYYHVVTGGFSMLYFDVADYGWAYTIGSTIAFFVVGDFGLYWAHRWMHRKGPYRFAHCIHHRYRTPSAFTAVAAHPFELLTFQVVSMSPIFFLPMHPAGVIGVLLYQHTVSLIDHSGIRFGMVLPWQGPAAFHDDHHTYFHVNFAQTIHWWDRIFGTWRCEELNYGEKSFVEDQNERPVATPLSYSSAAIEQRSLARLEKRRRRKPKATTEVVLEGGS